jgi:hypothetical protein
LKKQTCPELLLGNLFPVLDDHLVFAGTIALSTSMQHLWLVGEIPLVVVVCKTSCVVATRWDR